ncbi:MAG: DUF2147 domain-containing protein [Bacteroidota bacterium]
MVFKFIIKKSCFLLIFIIFSSITASFSQDFNADDIIGKWIPQQNRSIVEIFKIEDKYYAKIIWLKDIENIKGENILDIYNPNKKLRSRHVLNMIFMGDFEFKRGQWVNGKVYDPESGNTYMGNIKMQSDNILELRGFIGITLFGRTSVWHRVKT